MMSRSADKDLRQLTFSTAWKWCGPARFCLLHPGQESVHRCLGLMNRCMFALEQAGPFSCRYAELAGSQLEKRPPCS